MKRFSEQLKKKSATIRLRASEKAELHSKIVAFMEYHPLPASVHKAPGSKGIDSFRYISIPSIYWQSFAAIFALFLVVVIPALAENSIPGDILYPVKVSVTEEIRSSLALTSYQKVDWETTRMERRISEARLLAQAGKLTPQAEANVLAAVQTHKQAAEDEIATLRTTDAEGATLAQLTLATVLDVQSSVLKADDSASTTAGMSTVSLASGLDAEKLDLTNSSDSNEVSFDRLTAQLEIETTRAYELLDSISKSKSATDQEQKDVRRRLSDLETKIKSATDENKTSTKQAKQDLRTSWSDLQKLISYMSDIDVRSNIAIETLVPVVMTDEEILTKDKADYAEATQNLVRINVGLKAVTDQSIIEKINLTLPKITDLLATASTTMQKDSKGAQASVSEALALTKSILNMQSFPLTDITSGTSTIATSTSASSTATSTPAIATSTATSTISSTTTFPVKIK